MYLNLNKSAKTIKGADFGEQKIYNQNNLDDTTTFNLKGPIDSN